MSVHNSPVANTPEVYQAVHAPLPDSAEEEAAQRVTTATAGIFEDDSFARQPSLVRSEISSGHRDAASILRTLADDADISDNEEEEEIDGAEGSEGEATKEIAVQEPPLPAVVPQTTSKTIDQTLSTPDPRES